MMKDVRVGRIVDTVDVLIQPTLKPLLLVKTLCDSDITNDPKQSALKDTLMRAIT